MHDIQLGVVLDPLLVRMLAELDVKKEHIQNFDPVLHENIIKQVDDDISRINDEVEEKLKEDTYIERYMSIVTEYVLEGSAEKIAKLKEGIDLIFGEQRRKILF